MTAAQLRASCYGEPFEISRVTLASGVGERWDYRAQGVVVYLSDGRVSAVQDQLR